MVLLKNCAACVAAILSTVLLKWDFMVVLPHHFDKIVYRHVDFCPHLYIH
jgi:hypothetical protein